MPLPMARLRIWLKIPHMPFFMVVALGSAAYTVVLLIQAVRAARGVSDEPEP